MNILSNRKGTMELVFLLALIVTVLFVLGMVFGDNQRMQMVQSARFLQGQESNGFGSTRLTPARMKSRSLKNFDDARIREDQYNRKHEPMKTRKKGGLRP